MHQPQLEFEQHTNPTFHVDNFYAMSASTDSDTIPNISENNDHPSSQNFRQH